MNPGALFGLVGAVLALPLAEAPPRQTGVVLGTGTTAPTQNTTLQIINPDTVYLDRDNQIDFRVGKVLKYRGLRAPVNLDLYNLTNASTILTANAAYALTNNAWLTPTAISNPRLIKISFTLDLR